MTEVVVDEAIQRSIGKTLAGIHIAKIRHGEAEDCLRLVFTDGAILDLWDGGQDCCENRYMATDDQEKDFVGARLVSIEVRDAPNIQDGCDVHEVQFLVIVTDRGNYTVSTHNEHNGYYGGFSIYAEIDEPASPTDT